MHFDALEWKEVNGKSWIHIVLHFFCIKWIYDPEMIYHFRAFSEEKNILKWFGGDHKCSNRNK